VVHDTAAAAEIFAMHQKIPCKNGSWAGQERPQVIEIAPISLGIPLRGQAAELQGNV
jgi:hypothetical protein